MKKSKLYHFAQLAVLESEKIIATDKLQILRTLFDAEDLELFREKEAEKENNNGNI